VVIYYYIYKHINVGGRRKRHVKRVKDRKPVTKRGTVAGRVVEEDRQGRRDEKAASRRRKG